MSKPRPKVVVGERYGLRTILGSAPDNERKLQCVEVQCDCGKVDVVVFAAMRCGMGLSCRSCGSRGWKNK